MPVPDKGIESGVPDALFDTEIVPLALPAAVGANTTLKVALDPAAIVAPDVMPFTLKPVPEAVTEETVRLAVPVFISMIDWDELLPVEMLPNETLVGTEEIAA